MIILNTDQVKLLICSYSITECEHCQLRKTVSMYRSFKVCGKQSSDDLCAECCANDYCNNKGCKDIGTTFLFILFTFQMYGLSWANVTTFNKIDACQIV